MTYDTRTGRFLRLLGLMLAFVFSFQITPASALPVQPGYWYLIGQNISGKTPQSVGDQYAAYLKDKHVKTYPGCWVVAQNYTGSIPAIRFDTVGGACGGEGINYSVPMAYVYPSCPANSGQTNATTCTCQSGYVEYAGQCKLPNDAECTRKEGESAFTQNTTSTYYKLPGEEVCVENGCKATITESVIQTSADGIRKSVGMQVTYGGGTCQAVPNQSPTPSTCKGTVGNVNGVDVCVPYDPNKNTTVTGGATKTSGTPATDGKPAVPGSTTTSQHTCVGSKCTTVTTTTTGGTGPNGTGTGSTTKTETTEQPKDDFCTKNPRASACEVPKCKTGDPTLGCMVAGKPTNGVIPKAEVNATTVGVDNLQGFNVGNSCPQPYQITVYGKPYKLEFKPLCDAAVYVKPLVLLGAALAALGIVWAALRGGV